MCALGMPSPIGAAIGFLLRVDLFGEADSITRIFWKHGMACGDRTETIENSSSVGGVTLPPGQPDRSRRRDEYSLFKAGEEIVEGQLEFLRPRIRRIELVIAVFRECAVANFTSITPLQF
jgi:hypothetical protein